MAKRKQARRKREPTISTHDQMLRRARQKETKGGPDPEAALAAYRETQFARQRNAEIDVN
jgi:hypothetical protein